jgi:hypothetical protein
LWIDALSSPRLPPGPCPAAPPTCCSTLAAAPAVAFKRHNMRSAAAAACTCAHVRPRPDPTAAGHPCRTPAPPDAPAPPIRSRQAPGSRIACGGNSLGRQGTGAAMQGCQCLARRLLAGAGAGAGAQWPQPASPSAATQRGKCLTGKQLAAAACRAAIDTSLPDSLRGHERSSSSEATRRTMRRRAGAAPSTCRAASPHAHTHKRPELVTSCTRTQ